MIVHLLVEFRYYYVLINIVLGIHYLLQLMAIAHYKGNKNTVNTIHCNTKRQITLCRGSKRSHRNGTKRKNCVFMFVMCVLIVF